MLAGWIIVSENKVSGKAYLSGTGTRPLNGKVYETEVEAVEEAKRKARDCSDEYTYYVYKISPVALARRASPPVEVVLLDETESFNYPL